MLHFLSNKYNYSFIKGKKNIYLQIKLCMFLGMSFSCGIQGTLGDIPGSRSLGNLQLNYYFSGKERNLLDSKKCIHIFLKKGKGADVYNNIIYINFKLETIQISINS